MRSETSFVLREHVVGCPDTVVKTASAKRVAGRPAPSRSIGPKARSCVSAELKSHRIYSMSTGNGNDQANRAISTGKLHALPHFHTRPINVVVYHGSDREHSFSGGFPA